MIHVGGDVFRNNEQLAVQQARVRTFGASGIAERAGRVDYREAGSDAFAGYIVGFGPWSTKGSVSLHDFRTTNTANGLTEVSNETSGIAGVTANQVAHVDLFKLDEQDGVAHLQVLAVRLNAVRADTGGRVSIQVRGGQQSFDRDTGQVPEKKKKAKVKQLVIMPVPAPPGYIMRACFDVAANGDAKLIDWTRSKDTAYNQKIDESLKKYLFTPATLSGVAVRDTVCVNAGTTKNGG
jgi:hypothetical protein